MQVPPESITFQHYNGTISLFSPRLPEVHGPRGEHFPGHITLLTAAEYKSIGRPPIDNIISAISVDHIYLVGEGCSKNETVKWESVVWNAGDRWRDGLGLSRRFFHVTTSAGDDHSLNKGIQSVINRLGADGLVDRLENMSVHGMYGVFVSAWTGHAELEYGPPLFVSQFYLPPPSSPRVINSP